MTSGPPARSRRSALGKRCVREIEVSGSWKPTKDQVAASLGGTVPDVIAHGLRILFSGINPSLYSAAVGHHFARPGNRFWPTLHATGFTPRLFSPIEDRALLGIGIGITNVVDRATAAADELSPEELAGGGLHLEEKVGRYRPAIVALLGITAYRAAFRRPRAGMGLQVERISEASLWVLPNPSGRNGHFSVEPFRELRRASGLEFDPPGEVLSGR
jgi:TDG/mug DNA glycosylase family protein